MVQNPGNSVNLQLGLDFERLYFICFKSVEMIHVLSSLLPTQVVAPKRSRKRRSAPDVVGSVEPEPQNRAPVFPPPDADENPNMEAEPAQHEPQNHGDPVDALVVVEQPGNRNGANDDGQEQGHPDWNREQLKKIFSNEISNLIQNSKFQF